MDRHYQRIQTYTIMVFCREQQYYDEADGLKYTTRVPALSSAVDSDLCA